MSSTENLHFKIGLSGVYWDKKPQYTVLVNDTKYSEGIISQESGIVEFIEFDVSVDEGPCKLTIRFENKTNDQVVKDDETKEDFVIVKDMLLHIDSVEIDDIDIGELTWRKSTFVGDDPSRPVLDNCVDLGWNGSWTLPVESPFYIWLLENI